jgi:O-antigen/teichoic acid export membrane protein
MQATLARFLRLTAGYSLVTLIGPIFTVLLTPLYTRVLAPADYGVVEAATAASSFVNVLALFAIDQALSAHFYDGDDAHRRNLATTAGVLVAALGLACGLALALNARSLAVYLFKDPGRRFIILALAVGAVTAPLYSLLLAALRLAMQVRRANALAVGFLLATVASNVVLILGFRLKATGVITANVLGSAAACVLGLALAAPVLRGRSSQALAGPLLRTGASLLPGAYSFLALASIDRLLLTQFVSQTDLGLYSIANKLAGMLFVLLSAAWYAWWPMALELAPRPGSGRQLSRMLEYLAALAMVLASGMSLFAPEILAVFTRSAYVPAAPFAVVLMACMGPLGLMTQLFMIGLYVEKRTHWISVAYGVAAAVNIGLNLWWDPTWGVWGAVWATLGAGLLLAGLAYALGQRIYPVPYRLGRLLLVSLVYAGEMAVLLLWPGAQAWPVKLAALGVLAAAILATGIVTPAQLSLGWRELRRHLARRWVEAEDSRPL